jgi:predicted HicB family RNase H-like nuclease
MYELADWGTPMAPPEVLQREKIIAQLPHGLVRVLRSRARGQGVSLNTLIDRLLHEAVSLPARHDTERVTAAAGVFD